MKNLILITALLLGLGAAAQNETGVLFLNEDFMALDHQKHFFAGHFVGFVGGVVYGGINEVYLDREPKRWELFAAGLVTSFVAGVVHEQFFDDRYDWNDVKYTTFGGVTGSLTVSLVFNLDTRIKRRREQKRISITLN